MAVTVAQLNTYVSNAQAHIAASEWADARIDLLNAKVTLAALPDSEQRGESLRWDRNAIDKLLEEVAAKEAAGSSTVSSIKRTKIEYAAVTD